MIPSADPGHHEADRPAGGRGRDRRRPPGPGIRARPGPARHRVGAVAGRAAGRRYHRGRGWRAGWRGPRATRCSWSSFSPRWPSRSGYALPRPGGPRWRAADAPAGAGRQRPAPPQPAPGRVDRTTQGGRHLRPNGPLWTSCPCSPTGTPSPWPRRSARRRGPGSSRPAATRCRSGTSSSTMRSTRTGRCRCAGRFHRERGDAAGGQRRPRLAGRPPSVPGRRARRRGRGRVAAPGWPGGRAARSRRGRIAAAAARPNWSVADADLSATSSAPTWSVALAGWGLARPTRGATRGRQSWPRLSTWPCAAAPPPGWRLPCWSAGRRRRLVDLCHRALTSGVGSDRV